MIIINGESLYICNRETFFSNSKTSYYCIYYFPNIVRNQIVQEKIEMNDIKGKSVCLLELEGYREPCQTLKMEQTSSS